LSRKSLEVVVAVLDDRRLDVLEHLAVDALRVVVGLEQERRDGAEERGLAHSGGAVGAEVPGDLAGAHRETCQHDVVEPQVLEQRVEVAGERVVVVADGRLARAAEPAPVVADHAVAGGEQHPLLALPRVAVEAGSRG
jgi:hypothetical protein